MNMVKFMKNGETKSRDTVSLSHTFFNLILYPLTVSHKFAKHFGFNRVPDILHSAIVLMSELRVNIGIHTVQTDTVGR